MSISAIVAAGVIKLAHNLSTDAYNGAKASVIKWRDTIKAENQIAALTARMDSLRFVKTILYPEAAVDIVKFFCIPSCKIDGQKKKIDHITDLPPRAVIAAPVGHGKSILLRHLACTQLASAERLPLFIELHRVHGAQTLMQVLLKEADTLGVEIDQDVLEYLMENGRVLLLLDAFDELSPSLQGSIQADLDDLLRKYENIACICTSRQHGAILRSNHLPVVPLLPIGGKDYEEQVYKYYADDLKMASRLIDQVNAVGVPLLSLLDTPLMVALLIKRFRVQQSVPETKLAFFEGLFPLLVRDHDARKGAVDRKRESGLSDTDMQDVFEMLAFVTRLGETRSLKYDAMMQEVAKILQRLGLRAAPDAVVRDIVQITSLIVHEGGEYLFVQRGIQEYYAALFVSKGDDDFVEAFCERADANWRKWEQELIFLESIDPRKFAKFFIVPAMRRYLGIGPIAPTDSWVLNSDLLERVYMGWAARVDRMPPKPAYGGGVVERSMDEFAFPRGWVDTRWRPHLDQAVTAEEITPLRTPQRMGGQSQGWRTSNMNVWIKLADIAAAPSGGRFMDAAREHCRRIERQLKDFESLVQRKKSNMELLDLLDVAKRNTAKQRSV